jgi:nucleotide-binding universal stress UspA family protein
MKRILIPTDFSACAKNALQFGAAIAAVTGAEILLLHVIYTTTGLENIPEKLDDYPEVNAAVTNAKTSFKRENDNPALKNIKVTTQLDVGTPFQVILLTAKRWKPDLIIMGSHGAEEVNHPFVGSNAQKVLRGAECPVLSVQKSHSVKNLKKLTYASNFEPGSEKASTKILGIAEALGAKVNLLFVNTPLNFRDTKYINERLDWFEKTAENVKFTRAIYCDYDVNRGVANYLSDKKDGIAALVTRTRQGLPSYTLGIAESVAYLSPVPVLSMNFSK